MRLSASARMMMLLLFRGRLIAVPPVEEALEFLAHEGAPHGDTAGPSPRDCRAIPSRSAPHWKI